MAAQLVDGRRQGKAAKHTNFMFFNDFDNQQQQQVVVVA